MGQPVKILGLTESLIRLSAVRLWKRAFVLEKTVREALVKTVKLDKMESSLIFFEKNKQLNREELDERLKLLDTVCNTGRDEEDRCAFKVGSSHLPLPGRDKCLHRTSEKNAQEYKLKTVVS